MSGRKETVLDLAKFVDKGVQVKLTGGRQVYPNATRADSGICTPPVTGTLKGYDQLLNLVLDEAIEFEREQDDPLKLSAKTRQLGLIVCRGTAVMLVSPTEGTEEIKNPFQEADGEQTTRS
ncbi:sm-like protein LSM7 isoform X1 [Hordeum vulgare subsp. vulgare]|uniref:sm-like protein LSM7 isoform X1 n=1 Tax=Hordeum vulgare subsp. vulgare TaxID=112509 RepID=UPI001D1A38D7|nr:sm-like protein LSM7 isoform X1 [Hordeum vulgare subsp. vulgare]